MALVSLALWLGTMSARPAPPWRSALAGALLALGVLLWLPYVLVVAAVLAAIYLLAPGESALHLRAATIATGTCALIGMSAYLGAASANGIRSFPAFTQWIAGSSHGISRPGLARVIIGLPRSFVHMGTDGREVKRYLAGDPLNPVTAAQLATLPLWPKLLVFYLALVVVMWFALRRARGRVLLLLLLLAAAPVVGLGVASRSGGEEERYLALYPFLILLVTWAAFTALVSIAAWFPPPRRPSPSSGCRISWHSTPGSRTRAPPSRRPGSAAWRPVLDARSVIIVPQGIDPLGDLQP